MLPAVQPGPAPLSSVATAGKMPLAAKICFAVGLLLIVVGGGLAWLGATVDGATAKNVLTYIGGCLGLFGLLFAPTSVFVLRRFCKRESYSDGERVGLYLGWLFAMLGLGLLMGFGYGLPGELALAVSSVDVKCRVTDVDLGGSSSTRPGAQSSTEIYFRCKHRGRTYRGWFATFDADKIARYRKGKPIRCKVSRLGAGYARAKGESYWLMGWWGLAALLPLGLGLALALGALIRKRRRASG